ncbi:10 kDa heat shock protein, mitochondrial-like [Sapajus apella]|uniref:10 kDa heat shock protein, mitochondrial n=1 Tax=Sapajus apella TaxID=9515 RepID=A0A6J3IS68_SAPAP|nr:10 kDa heat shock protein, mitochondrial-like [Sapajus apella]
MEQRAGTDGSPEGERKTEIVRARYGPAILKPYSPLTVPLCLWLPRPGELFSILILFSNSSKGSPGRSPRPVTCTTLSSNTVILYARSNTRQGRVESEAEGVVAGQAFRKFLPLFDRVLTERSAAETVTRGGIMFPEKSQGKILQATVVAVGSGSKGKDGEIQPVSVKVGDKVLFPEDGGTKVVLDDKDYFLFRDGDILGKYVD